MGLSPADGESQQRDLPNATGRGSEYSSCLEPQLANADMSGSFGVI